MKVDYWPNAGRGWWSFASSAKHETPKKDYTEALINDSIRMASADDLSFGTIKVK
jgi:hypothetical protein